MGAHRGALAAFDTRAHMSPARPLEEASRRLSGRLGCAIRTARVAARLHTCALGSQRSLCARPAPGLRPGKPLSPPRIHADGGGSAARGVVGRLVRRRAVWYRAAIGARRQERSLRAPEDGLRCSAAVAPAYGVVRGAEEAGAWQRGTHACLQQLPPRTQLTTVHQALHDATWRLSLSSCFREAELQKYTLLEPRNTPWPSTHATTGNL